MKEMTKEQAFNVIYSGIDAAFLKGTYNIESAGAILQALATIKPEPQQLPKTEK